MAGGVLVVEENSSASTAQTRKVGEVFVHNPYFLPPPTNQDEASSSSQCDETPSTTSAQTKLRKRGSRGGRRVQAQRAAQAARKQQQYATTMQSPIVQPTAPFAQVPMYGTTFYPAPYYAPYEPTACSPCCAASAGPIMHDCEDNNDCCSIGSSASFSYPRARAMPINSTNALSVPQQPMCASSSTDCCSSDPMQAPAHMATPCASSMYCMDNQEEGVYGDEHSMLKHTVSAC